jgi:hypothetical protein
MPFAADAGPNARLAELADVALSNSAAARCPSSSLGMGTQNGMPAWRNRQTHQI